uniref:L-aspartate oxidase n=1 Tax=Tetraselmis sp. GSL018 TaxID=582737 RepID=A0A061SA55_9CHLO|eukprot:CAMPEP_0177598268 /NCGR_PEP_ID=MMETSP0419_2-20121207/12237_1 /TAXON_ID=582737 /ORGANISM="Tetraselmis sp., Strain GSL018" /LENGTH=669 /DNA_ID=CAMNT_0019090659 /DNA_START=492 /DNA_END=2501 /DNA_ORIENTATION=-
MSSFCATRINGRSAPVGRLSGKTSASIVSSRRQLGTCGTRRRSNLVRKTAPRLVVLGAHSSWTGSNTDKRADAHLSYLDYDFVVVGSGIAGLTYANKVAEHGRVAVITKDEASEGCTQYAQGGICAVLDQHDSVDKHVRDTTVAGAYLNDPSVVEMVCSEGPERVLELIEFGAKFTLNGDGSLHLTREGGHSDRRIVHAADMTGAEIERALLETARRNPNIEFFEHHMVIDLVTDDVGGSDVCLGVDVLDQRDMSLMRFGAPVTLLASGGGGQVYPNTTNPHVATGDGIAMAHRARASIANMEFVQFHPTGLYTPGAGSRRFLISEAVRGEGGLLFNLDGHRFMPSYDDREELAPRDVVARSINTEMMRRGEPHVWLDISHKPSSMLESHFPNIARHCLGCGIDIRNDPIPVVPTQHYMCGGVQTGLRGETSLVGLFAAGEVACTGLHGANRLASNSLLEGLVLGHRAAQAGVLHAESMRSQCAEVLARSSREAAALRVPQPRHLSAVAEEWVQRKRKEVNRLLWEGAGIVRCAEGLESALDELAHVYVESKELMRSLPVSSELLELVNLATVGELIISSALMRRESRGLHYMSDFPSTSDGYMAPTVINQSLRKRYDLEPVHSKIESSGGIRQSVGLHAPANSAVMGRKPAKRHEMSLKSTPSDQEQM